MEQEENEQEQQQYKVHKFSKVNVPRAYVQLVRTAERFIYIENQSVLHKISPF